MSEFKTFPGSFTEALALNYVQHQDLNGKTPAEIHTMYWEALYEIRKDYKEKHDSGYFKEHP